MGLIHADGGEVNVIGHAMPSGQANSKMDIGFASEDMKLYQSATLATGINNGKSGVQSLLAGTTVTATFTEDGTVTGSSGCNRFSGAYERDGNAIKIGPLAGTRMMCTEPAGIMEQESHYLKALENASTFNVEGKTLELRDAQAALQVKFAVSEK